MTEYPTDVIINTKLKFNPYLKMKTKEILSKKIKTLRKEKGLTQQEIADKLEIPRPSVSQIEQGERDITATELIKLLEIFNTSLKTITKEEKKPQHPKSKYTTITFIRHGEAMDDIYNQYGGWADPELSAKGLSKAYESAEKIKSENIETDIIFTSPLKRAKQKAEILSKELKTPLKVSQYLKERNTYGLLCGINKDLAQKNFPRLVKAYENKKYVLGSERYEDFINRVKLCIDFLQNQNYQNIFCVTHGKFIRALIKEFLNMNYNKLRDDCILKVGLDKKGMFYIESEGITFKR